MYYANLEPFTGFDEVIASPSFRTIYSHVIAAAREIMNASGDRRVTIMQERASGDFGEPINANGSIPLFDVWKWHWGHDSISIYRRSDGTHLFTDSGRVFTRERRQA